MRRSRAAPAAPDPDALSDCSRIGHNGGPALDPGADWRAFCWRKAHGRAWKTPPRDIALARLARAQELGISYRDYTSTLLDRGIHL